MILTAVLPFQLTELLLFGAQTRRNPTRRIAEEEGLSRLGPFDTTDSGRASHPKRIALR